MRKRAFDADPGGEFGNAGVMRARGEKIRRREYEASPGG